MKELVGLIFTFVIIAVAITVGLSSISTIHSTNIGNCVINSSGGLVNCSLSDNDFNALNQSSTASANTFSTLIVVE
jgi:hypothetical protein